MKKIDFLVACAKIMVLHKTVYKNEAIEEVKSKILEEDKDHEMIKTIEEALKPIVVAPVSKPVAEQKSLNLPIETIVESKIVKDAVPVKTIDELKELLLSSLDGKDKVTVVPIPYGIPIRIQSSIVNPTAVINVDGSSVNVTEAYLTIRGSKDLKYGTFLGYVTMDCKFWNGTARSLIVDEKGDFIYESPIEAIIKAMTDPSNPNSKLILDNCEVCLVDLQMVSYSPATKAIMYSSIEEKTNAISNVTASLYETYVVDEFDVKDIAEFLEVCSRLYFVRGFLVMTDSVVDRNKCVTAKTPTDFILPTYVDEPSFIVDAKISSVKSSINRFGEISLKLTLEDGLFFNTSIPSIKITDSKIIKENSFVKGDFIKVVAYEDHNATLIAEFNSVLSQGANVKPIDKCPFCGGEISFGEEFVTCVNDSCCGSGIQKIKMFLKYLGVDFTKFNPKVIDDIYKAGYDTPYKFWNISYMNMTAAVDTSRKTNSYNLFTEIQRINNVGINPTNLYGASGCFRGVSYNLLKNDKSNIVKDTVKAYISGLSWSETKVMLNKFEDWLKINPFKVEGWE